MTLIGTTDERRAQMAAAIAEKLRAKASEPGLSQQTVDSMLSVADLHAKSAAVYSAS